MRTFVISLMALVAMSCSDKAVSSIPSSGDAPPGDSDATNNQGELTAVIVRPNGDISILSGDDVTFEAEFTFDGVRVNPGSVSWSTDVFLGDGNPLANQLLPDGTHTVTVTGVYEGDTATDSVQVTVGSFAVRISNPDNGDIEDVGSNMGFRGEAFIADGGTIELVSAGAGAGQRNASYEWSSSLDGVFGNQDQFQYDLLSEGAHDITLTVTDDHPTDGTGQSGSATVSITIAPPNTGPTVTITDPSSCPVDLEVGSTLTLQGTVTDPDPADAGITGTWTDSVSGHTQEGGSYLFGPGATVGKHQISLEATDNRGDSDRAVCDVYVIEVGGAREDLFPDPSPINDNLIGGNDNVNWVGADPDGNTWIGNDQGITVFDSTDTATGTYDGDVLLGGPSQVNVNDATYVGGSAFVATDEGLAQCDYAGGVLSNCSEIVDEEFDQVAANGDPAGNGFVAGASEAGLFVTQFTAGNPPVQVSFDEGNSNIPATEVLDAVFLGSTLYVATDGGVCVAEDLAGAVADTAELCTSVIDEDNSLLPDNEVRALTVRGDELWIGTADGVVQYAPGTGAMVIWDRDSGLGNDNVNDIAFDDDGIAWIATNGGVSRLDPTTGSITNFTGVDFGTPGENNVSSIYVDGNGTKWFGTNNGIVRYDGV